MGLSFSLGDITWSQADAAGTVYTVSGLGFQPKALFFFTSGVIGGGAGSEVDHARHSCGFATSTSDRRCIGFRSQDATAAQDCQEIYRADAVVAVCTTAPAVDGLLDLNSITSDGFTLIVDDQLATSGMTVHWCAWGGSDIVTAATGEIVEPAATGNQSYSVTGWLTTFVGDAAVMFAGCQLTAAAPTTAAQDSGFMFGAATGTGAGNQWVMASNEDDGSATMDTDRYRRGDECLAMMTVAGGNPNARATFNGFDSAGFDLNWTARAVTNRRYIYLAIQGGGWKAGSYTIDLSNLANSTTVSGLKFRPRGGLSASGSMAESAAGTSSTGANLGLGCWKPTGAAVGAASGFISNNGSANAEILLNMYFTPTILGFPGTGGTDIWTVEIEAYNSDGFRVGVTLTEALTDFQSYLAFGDSPGPTVTYPHHVARGRAMIASGFKPPDKV